MSAFQPGSYVPKIVIYRLFDPDTETKFYEIELQKEDGTAVMIDQAADYEGVVGSLAAFLFGGTA